MKDRTRPMALFFVILEYRKKKPRLFGPFGSETDAHYWLQCQPYPELCEGYNYTRPHSSPNQFRGAYVVQMELSHLMKGE